MKARHLTFLGLLTLVLVLTVGVSTAWANATSPIDPTVASEMSQTNGPIPVIVFTHGDINAALSALPRSVDTTTIPALDAFAASLTPSQITTLASEPTVTAISNDSQVEGMGWSGWSRYMDYTNIAIGLPAMVQALGPNAPTGAGVNVAVLDSGVAPHSDLTGGGGNFRVVAFKNFVNNRQRMYDDAGHGTFVAGLIAGDGTASTPTDLGGKATVTYTGVAPQAGIVALKVLDKFGNGRESNILRAIAWTIQHKDDYNIRVLNISLGGDVTGPVATDPMAMAVEAAWKAGIVVVAAAGNEGDFGPGGILSPGNDPYVITVGASNTQQTADTSDDSVCSYSSIGPTMWDEYAKPDVVAPGNRNISLRVPLSYVDRTWPENRIAVSTYIPDAPWWMPPQYFVLSGTSTATPVVSGLAALMISADPSLTPDDVKARLMATAKPVAIAPADPLQEGAGEVDAAAALASTLKAHGPVLSAQLGDGSGTSVLPADTYQRWNDYKWSKYRWTKYRWTKYRWTKYAWTKYAWAKYAWTKYMWTTLIQGE